MRVLRATARHLPVWLLIIPGVWYAVTGIATGGKAALALGAAYLITGHLLNLSTGKAQTMKSFGRKNNVQPVRRVPFEFYVQRGGEPERHEFQAVLALDAASLTHTLAEAAIESPNVLAAYMKTVRKMIDNTDGIPAKWEPVPVRGAVEPVDLGGGMIDETQVRPPSFRVPYGPGKGNLLPMTEASRYLKEEQHSSRRRWLDLLDDDDVTIDFKDVSALFEYLVAEASGNRSGASS